MPLSVLTQILLCAKPWILDFAYIFSFPRTCSDALDRNRTPDEQGIKVLNNAFSISFIEFWETTKVYRVNKARNQEKTHQIEWEITQPHVSRCSVESL